MPIRLLPPEVASQIAAGEVIERPASVVKELVENSLDAGVNTISVTISEAGQRLIEVADNGCGISSAELALSVSRHATSKLQTAEDLFNIHTLGFRGEALASIGSVSRLTIITRTSELELGASIRVEAGKAGEVAKVGAPVGTLVRVEDLFYNVPARLKFLKHDATERRQIDNLVTRYALAYPQVRFRLVQEDRPALQTSGNGNRREVLAALYGVEPARQMIEVFVDDNGIQVSGYTSPITLTRSNRREIQFFVNGRPVQDVALTTAVVQAYHTMLMVGRYPISLLFIDLPPDVVDVNVHPTKAEVRFRRADFVFSNVQRAVRRSLLAHTPLSEISPGLSWPQPSVERPRGAGLDPSWQETARDLSAEKAIEQDTPVSRPPVSSIIPGRAPILRLIGQIAATYLVAEGPDGLYLIDQHAAHERVLFEKLVAQQHASDQVQTPAQALLQPVTVSFPPAAARLLEQQLPMLSRVGFNVEPFGVGTFLVRSIPALLSGMDPAAALQVLVGDFEEDETPLKNEWESRIIARVCKRAAVKAGQVLSAQEQQALLEDLERCTSPRTCPHGRPTMIHLSVDLLERQFGRKGARQG